MLSNGRDNNNNNYKSNNSSSSNTDLQSLKAQLSDQLHSYKSKLDLLNIKVDSMDNTYDKRLANLEAVVTPLIAAERLL